MTWGRASDCPLYHTLPYSNWCWQVLGLSSCKASYILSSSTGGNWRNAGRQLTLSCTLHHLSKQGHNVEGTHASRRRTVSHLPALNHLTCALQHFSKWGNVVDVYFPGKGRPKRVNYCFVTFDNWRAAQRACLQSERSIAGSVSPE